MVKKKKHHNKRPWFVSILVIGLVIGFVAGVFAAPEFNPELELVHAQIQGEVETDGLHPVNISIDGSTLSLINVCNAVMFDITNDQAFSISHGIEGTMALRPLPHDLFRDVMENFGISVTQINIDRYEDEIYKATIFMKMSDQILSIDARPSDSVALATRLNKQVYASDEVMLESVRIC